MGVVIKQSFWGTFIAYLGVVIGYINTLYLRPEFFSLEEIGLFTLVTANAMMVSPLTSMGMPGTYIKYFPELDSKKLAHQFFTFQFLIILITSAVVITVAYLNQDWIISKFSKGSSEYIKYLSITGIIIVVNSLFEHLFGYCSSILKVIFPSFLREVFLRVGAIALVIGYAGGYFDFDWAVKGLAINYLLVLIILLFYLIIKERLRFSLSLSLINKEWRRKIFTFSTYTLAMAASFAIMNNVSYNQVSSVLGDASNGIFVTCFFIGVIVEMPKRNMARVIAPLISSNMSMGILWEVHKLYKKGSITMTVIGVLLFIGIMTNVNDLFSFIPQGEEFSKGYGVVLAVCTAKLTLMLFSFAGEIIAYSSLYRYNLLIQVVSAIILVVLNYFLIPIYGLNGVALSYFLAIFINTFGRFLFVAQKFQMNPFMRSHLYLLIISTVTFVLFYFFDPNWNAILKIFSRSVLTTAFFTFLIYKFKISMDINQLIDSLVNRFFKSNN